MDQELLDKVMPICVEAQENMMFKISDEEVATVRTFFDACHIRKYSEDVVAPLGEGGLVAALFPDVFRGWFSDVVEALHAEEAAKPKLARRRR